MYWVLLHALSFNVSNIKRSKKNANLMSLQWKIKSSRPVVFCKKVVLGNCKIHDCGLQLYKKDTLAKVFAREFCEISKNTFYCRTLLMAASEKRSVKNKGLNIIILQCPDEKSVVENADCQKFSDKQNIAQGKLPKP